MINATLLLTARYSQVAGTVLARARAQSLHGNPAPMHATRWQLRAVNRETAGGIDGARKTQMEIFDRKGDRYRIDGDICMCVCMCTIE